jgi:hypothetical protein
MFAAMQRRDLLRSIGGIASKAWYDRDVIGPDLGMIALMAENLRSGSIWEAFMKNDNLRHAMHAVGFQPDTPHPRLTI